MISGAAPRIEWRSNPGGTTRTMDEAIQIARRWGVVVPDYVQFSVDEFDWLDEKTTAKTTTFEEFDRTIIDWTWFFPKKTGKVPFLIRKDLMSSDEAIVAVIGHEMFELEMRHGLLGKGAPIEKRAAETSPDNPGNAHWQAWDHADELVERMRGREHDQEIGRHVRSRSDHRVSGDDRWPPQARP